MKVYNNVLELIGNTPIVKLSRYCKVKNIKSEVYSKLDMFNPSGSSKARIALKIIEKGENEGFLKKGSVIIEPTSGNTGIGIAMISNIKGYKTIITMPSNMSEERIKILQAYGAEVVLTDQNKGMVGAIEKANEIKKQYKNSYILDQFRNFENVNAHYKTTGKEIFNEMEGKIDYFIAGVGTGGTITGVGKYLKEKNKDIKIIAVEPAESPMLTQGKSGTHGIQGIGANFIPEILDLEIIDKIVCVNTKDAVETVKELVKLEGLLVGVSSGAVIKAVEKLDITDKNIVVFLPDSGEKYLSSNV